MPEGSPLGKGQGGHTLPFRSEVVEMTLELERAQQADGVAAKARLGSLQSTGNGVERRELVERLRAGGVQHEDMRDWLEQVDALGELRVLEGVDWQENIGRIAEMLVHTDGA